MNSEASQRGVDKIAGLAREADDLVSFWTAATAVIRKEVPHYLAPCWYTLDPSTLLITSHYHEGLAEFPAEWLQNEYYGPDLLALAEVARSPGGMLTLHEATSGDPSGSERWKQNMEMGADQELLAALRTTNGEVWGALGLYREAGQPLFDDDEKTFLGQVGPHLAEGARRALLFAEAAEPDRDDAPGIVTLDETLRVRSWTPGFEPWLSRLPGGDGSLRKLPPAILSVASSVLGGPGTTGNAKHSERTRVQLHGGLWAEIHGSLLRSQDGVHAVVVVEPAGAAGIYPMLLSAYGLTDREREVAHLVLRGSGTAGIAESLGISPLTVQQHLKAVFDKAGVRSRRELVGRVFFAHYEPRLRENERRVATNRSVRGGPLAGAPRGQAAAE